MYNKCPKCNGTGLEQLSDEEGEIGVAVECSCQKIVGNVYIVENICAPISWGNSIRGVCRMINDRFVPIISVA